MVKIADSGPPIESRRIVPMLLVGLVLISMAGVLIVGASGQVQGLDQGTDHDRSWSCVSFQPNRIGGSDRRERSTQ